MPIGDTIFQLIDAATDDELAQLCQALRIEPSGDRGVDRTNISREYRSAAGNSFANIFRDDHVLPYKRILIDVADKLKPGSGWTTHKLDDPASEEDVESSINHFVMERFDAQLKKLSPAERRLKAEELKLELKRQGIPTAVRTSIAGSIAAGTVGALGANAAVMSIFYSGLLYSLWASLFGPSTILLIASGAGLGLLTMLPFAASVLATPAYRKTIPCTLQLIRIRYRLRAEAELNSD